MKKIAFYIGALGKGGAERVIVNLAQALLEKGHQVLLVTSVKLEDEYPMPEGAKRIIIYKDLEVLGKNRIKNFCMRFLAQRRAWKEERPDIIVSFLGKNNAMSILTAFGLSIPVLISVRGEPREEYYNKPLQLCAKYLFPFAAGVIMQTEASKGFFNHRVVERSVVLPNPLNPSFVEDFEKFIPQGEERCITLVGRIDANKNHRLVIDAFARLAERFPHYRMEIWGEGEDRTKLLTYVESLGLTGRIHLPGTTEDVKEKLRCSSFYILSSNTEGMPNSLMEAMAMGLPVISTDCPCGGPAMLIENGVNGLLVPVGDQEAMEQAMEKLMGDEGYGKVLGEKAMEIRRTLHPEKVINQWEEYILSKCRK